MPRLFSFILICLCTLVPRAAHAQNEFWVSPEVGSVFGQTDFELELSGVDGGNDIKLRSLLEWPLDFLLIGTEVGARFDKLWLRLRFHTNLGDARGTMDDSDYVSSRSANVPETRFAFTKSETGSRALLADLAIGLDLFRISRAVTLGFNAGYRHEHYALSAFGGEGTYFDENGNPAAVFVSSTIRVVDYEVDHMLPFVGAQLTLSPSEHVSIPLFARAYALHSRSRDDHLMRGKIANGISNGAGASLSAFPTYVFNAQWSVGLAAEYFFLKGLNGVLRQHFYEDDPSTKNEDERDLDIPDADFYVASQRFHLALSARATW